MPGQGDIAAVAVVVRTHVSAFELSVWVTLLGAGVPVVSAVVAAFDPTIFIRTLNVVVTDDLTLDISVVGWTVLWTLVVTCL